MAFFTWPPLSVSAGGLATEAEQIVQTALLTSIDADTSALAGAVSGTELQVDVVSSALPAGAATLAEQQSQTVLLTSLDGKDFATQTTLAALAAEDFATETTLSALNAKVTAVDTGAVVVSSSALPTGAATEATLASIAAEDFATETTLAAINTKTPALGQATMAGSVPVAIASDQTPVNTALAGSTVEATVRVDYSSTAVTTGAWVELIASLANNVRAIEIFDSSGQTLELGLGAALSETRLLLVFPGGNGRISVSIAAAERISIRAVSGTANVGELLVNFYG